MFLDLVHHRSFICPELTLNPHISGRGGYPNFLEKTGGA